MNENNIGGDIESPPKINVTKDYSMFSLKKENRDIRKSNVEKLTNSFIEGAFERFSPLLVSEDFIILDGQHRFEALKKLNRPIYYITCPDELKFMLLNINQSNWDNEAYLKYYSKLGNENYIILKKYIEQAKLNVSGLFALLNMEHDRARKVFKNGKFIWNEENVDIDDIIEKYTIFSNFCKKHITIGKRVYTEYKVLEAFVSLFSYETFDFNYFMEKFSKYYVQLLPCTSTSQYLKIFVYIYNKAKKINILEKPKQKL